MHNMILDATGANEAEGGEPAAAPAGARQAQPPMPPQLILVITVPAGGFPGPRVTLNSPPYGKFTVAVQVITNSYSSRVQVMDPTTRVE
jgi:hypothetical protein